MPLVVCLCVGNAENDQPAIPANLHMAIVVVSFGFVYVLSHAQFRNQQSFGEMVGYFAQKPHSIATVQHRPENNGVVL